MAYVGHKTNACTCDCMLVQMCNDAKRERRRERERENKKEGARESNRNKQTYSNISNLTINKESYEYANI